MANSFGIWEEQSNAGEGSSSCDRELLGFAVCPLAAFFNHSCDGGLLKQFTRDKNGDPLLVFTTTKAIAAGEEITIQYGQTEGAVEERRQRLWNNYFFWCRCRRCSKESLRSANQQSVRP
jgi:SET and MYND domain-containing protein